MATDTSKAHSIYEEREHHQMHDLAAAHATDLPRLLIDRERDKEAFPDGDTQTVNQPLRLPLVITLAGAAFLNTLSVQSCVIILPSIGRSLDIPAERQQWIISAYYLTFGCFLLLWGRLADIYGRRIIFIWGSAWVTAMTIAVPFSPNEIVFDVLRGMQGLGAAANVPTAIGILGATFAPGRSKNYAFSIYSAGSSMGSVLGNLLGGVVGQYLSWKWLFWILAVLAASVTIVGEFVIPRPELEVEAVNARPNIRMDWLGGTMIVVSIVLLTFALTEGNVVGWATPWILVAILLSLLLLGVFVTWQWYLEYKMQGAPLIRVSIWHNGRFVAAQLIMAAFFAAFNNYLVFATYFVIQTTLRFIPTGVMGLCANFIAANVLSRVRGTYKLISSTLCVSISCVLMAVPIPPSTSYWAYGFVAMCLSTLGADTLHPTLTLFTAQSLPSADQALGGGLVTAGLQIGRSIGLALATAVQTAVENRTDKISKSTSSPAPRDNGLLQGLRAAEWFNFALATGACMLVVVAFRGKDKVGATMR